MQVKCVDYKDLETYVYVTSFRQNWLEYFTQVFKTELSPPHACTAPHHKGHAKSSAIIALPQCFGSATARKLLV